MILVGLDAREKKKKKHTSMIENLAKQCQKLNKQYKVTLLKENQQNDSIRIHKKQ